MKISTEMSSIYVHAPDVVSFYLKSVITFAGVVVDFVNTDTVHARLWCALVYVYLTVATAVTRLTDACVFADTVRADTTVCARFRLAFIDVHLTGDTYGEKVIG